MNYGKQIGSVWNKLDFLIYISDFDVNDGLSLLNIVLIGSISPFDKK